MSEDLFGTITAATSGERATGDQESSPADLPDDHDPFWLVIARRKLSVGPEWKWCRIEAIDKSARPNVRRDMIVEGGIPVLIKSGPRKGRPKWNRKECLTAVVTEEEIAAEAAAYEREIGKCSDCRGTKKTVLGFGKGGTTYRECRKCGGTGTP